MWSRQEGKKKKRRLAVKCSEFYLPKKNVQTKTVVAHTCLLSALFTSGREISVFDFNRQSE